jgi:hypothetical protein
MSYLVPFLADTRLQAEIKKGHKQVDRIYVALFLSFKDFEELLCIQTYYH